MLWPKLLKEKKSAVSSDQYQEAHPPQAPQLSLLRVSIPKPQNNNKRKRKPHHHHQPKKNKEWIWEGSSIDLRTHYLNLINNYSFFSIVFIIQYFFQICYPSVTIPWPYRSKFFGHSSNIGFHNRDHTVTIP